MGTNLVKNDYTSLPTSTISKTDLAKVSQANRYLSRIQLFTKGKAIDNGLIGPGRYGIPLTGGAEITDLGDEIDVIVFAARMKAMDASDSDDIRTYFDVNDPGFQEIVNADGLHGLSFLFFERRTGGFYEMFFCNKSARRVGPMLLPFVPTGPDSEDPHGPLAATLGIRYAKNKKGGWHVPTVSECKVPFSVEPSVEETIAEITKFLNPEDATEADERERAR